MGSQSPAVLHRKGDQCVEPPVDPCNRAIGGLVRVELPVLNQLRRVAGDLARLPLPCVSVHCGDDPV